MTHDQKSDPVVEFLLRLHKMERRGVTVRDVLLLFIIMAHPGIHGLDAAQKIRGTLARSGVHAGLKRLIRLGFIEDRRPQELARRASPSRFYALPAGVDFWNDLKS